MIGKIVHYMDRATLEHRAAIVTGVVDYDFGHLSLCVLLPTGIEFIPVSYYDQSGMGAGTWHWKTSCKH